MLTFLALVLIPLPAFAEGLSEAQLKNAMRPYMQAMRNCVEQQSDLDSSVAGRMDLSFTVGNRGRVTQVRVLTGEHVRTYVAGCVGGVLRSVKFPKFSGKPVVVPHFPLPLKSADPEGTIEEEEGSPTKAREAHRKLKKPVLKRLKMATGTIRACVNDHKEKPRRRRRKRTTTLSITFTLNPLGRVTEVKVLTKAHRSDYMAGCVAGVLAFVEFPYQGSDTLKFSGARIPRL
jgi:sRNA-binding protein